MKGNTNGRGVGGRIPSEYQECMYIEGTGTQYIDTGLNAPSGFTMEATMCLVTLPANYTALFGVCATTSPYCRQTIVPYSTQGRFQFCLGGLRDVTGLPFGTDFDIEYSSILPNAYVKINGVIIDSTTTSISGETAYNSENILLFTNQWIHANAEDAKARLYAFTMYDNNGTKTRDFVPCYRKSDTVVGLYDLISETFFTNQGTGTFLYG